MPSRLKTLLPVILFPLATSSPLIGVLPGGDRDTMIDPVDQLQSRLVALHQELEQSREEREATLRNLLMISLLIASGATLLLLILYRQKAQANRRLKLLNRQLIEQAKATEAANRELERLNQEMNQMLSFVSHDLKSPLAGIQGLAREINDEFAQRGDTDITHMSEMIEESARRMFQMVENLLDIQRIEAGHHRLMIAPCSLHEVALRVMEELEPVARRKNQRLTLELDTDTWARADMQALTRVVTNLVSNAIKYSPPGSEIRLKKPDDTGPGLCVCDEGPGISPAEEDRLFRKFVRLSTRPTAGESSTGLGLAISRSLIETMGGKIWHRPLPEGGSCFGFNLPAVVGTPPATVSNS